MTVNELYGAWMYRTDVDSDLKVWDINEGGFVFSRKNPFPNQNVDKIAVMEVKAFTVYYDKESCTNILLVHIGKDEDKSHYDNLIKDNLTD